MTKNLRHSILHLLKDYTLIDEPVNLQLIVSHFPNKSYANVSFQLSWLKKSGFVTVIGRKFSYEYYITPKGLEYLFYLNAKECSKNMKEALVVKLKLSRSAVLKSREKKFE